MKYKEAKGNPNTTKVVSDRLEKSFIAGEKERALKTQVGRYLIEETLSLTVLPN